MNDRQEKFVNLRDSRLKKESLLEDRDLLSKKSSEMNPDDWKLKMKSIEIDILGARGDIYKIEEDLGIDKNDPETQKLEEEALKDIEGLEKELEMVISSDKEDLFFIEEIHKVADDINIISQKITDAGYTLENIEDLNRSENPDDNAFYNKIGGEFEDLKINNRIELLKKEKPNLFIDVLIPSINDDYFKTYFLKDISDNRDIHHSKIVDSFIKNIPKDKYGKDFSSLKYSIDSRLIEEKRKTLSNLPIEEVLDLLVSEPELLNSEIEKSIRDKTIKLCESYMERKDIEDIKILINKLLNIGEENRTKRISSYLPEISPGVYFNDKDTISLFSGDMPKWIFDKYYSKIISGSFMDLVPERLFKEKSFHEDFNDTESISLESLNETLNKYNLSFDELSTEEKNYLLKKGKEKILSLYSISDFSQILELGYVDIDLIPSEYHLELKELILENYFKSSGDYMNFNYLNNFLEKTKFKIIDFPTKQKIKFLNSYDSQNVSLFDPADIKSLLLNNINDISEYNIQEILERADININDLPEEIIVTILNEKYYNLDFISKFNPEDLKRLILRKDSSFQSSGELEYILEFTNTNIIEFSKEKRYQIYGEMNNSVESIRKFFSVDDLRGILSDHKNNINPDSIPPEYMESLSPEIIQLFISNTKLDFIKSKEKRDWLFNKIREQNESKEQSDNSEINYEKQQKVERIKRVQESFYFIDEQEKLPKKLLEKFNNFKDKYGKKGEGIMALSIVAYGMEDLDKLMKSIEEIESILDLYDKENIPEGCKVTQGIEYEVGNLTGEEFNKESILGYVREAELIGMSANIKRGGAGSGSIYEHATRPTDNPYMLMVEMKLLGDAGFVDLNHKDFENGARGYHSSIGGETGLSATSNDMNFLYNTMTMASLGGLNLGTEIHSAKGIYRKTLENDIFEKRQGGDRVEIKGMGCDCIEQFNKSIITIHNSCIAIQVMEKYLKDSDGVLDKMPDDINSFDSFINESSLSKNDIEFLSEQEKEITYTWLKFKKDMLLALRQHNSSFAESEFGGFVVNEKDEFINTSDDIDINLNRKKLAENGIDYHDANKMKELFELPEESLFAAQSPEFLKNLGHVNNTFVFKEPILSADKLYVDKITGNTHVKRDVMANAHSTLTNMRAKGYIKGVLGDPFDSIVDTKGEMRDGYYYYQGASEEMISHKSQIIVNEFNKNMKELLINSSKDKLSMEKIEQYERSI